MDLPLHRVEGMHHSDEDAHFGHGRIIQGGREARTKRVIEIIELTEDRGNLKPDIERGVIRKRLDRSHFDSADYANSD